MANNKKFIAKNGLITPQSVIAGTELDNGTDTLQITGSSNLKGEVIISNGDSLIPSIDVVNSGGFLTPSLIAKFRGDSSSLNITNTAEGAYAIGNPGQNNFIEFFDDTDGINVSYAGSSRLVINFAGNNLIGNSTVDGFRILTVNDEGPGNGLDADTVDGVQAAQLLRNDEDGTLDGNLNITGDLIVSGVTTTINTETVLIADNIITLNSDVSGTPTENAGFEIERGSESNVSLQWNETNGYWEIASGGTTGRILTTGDEGANNGLDSDTVDGLEAFQFLRSDIDDTALGNITIEGDLFVGNGSEASKIIFENAGINRSIFSNNGEIGFLKPDANFSAYSNVIGEWIVTANNISEGNTISQEDIIAWNNVTANNDVIAENEILSKGDINALGDINASNDVTSGNDVNAVGNVNATNFNATGDLSANNAFIANDVEVSGELTANDITLQNNLTANNVIASKFIDSDNTLFFGDFSGTSSLNNMSLTGVISGNGDNDTFIEFTSSDSFGITTGGTERLSVNNTDITSNVDLRSSRFVDLDDINYYGDFASTSIMNSIELNDKLISRGDINTYIEFNSPDTFRVVTGASQRLSINNTSVNSSVGVYAPIYYDSNNTQFFGDFSGTSSFNIVGANELNATNINLAERITSDGDTNTYLEFDADDSFRIVTGASQRLSVDNNAVTSSVDVIGPRFVDGNDNSFFLNPNATSRVENIDLVGSIRADGDSDTKIEFGTDRFAISTGGAERLIVSNNAVTTTVAFSASSIADSDDPNYYIDPNQTSVLNRVGIDSRIFHNGDENTYVEFNGEDQFRLVTGGTERLTVDNNELVSSGDIIAPIFRDSSDPTNFFINPAGNSTINNIQVQGIVDGKLVISNPTLGEGALHIYQTKNDPNAPASLLIASDNDNEDIAFEVRGNSDGNAVDRTDRGSNDTSPDMNMQIWTNGRINTKGRIDSSDTIESTIDVRAPIFRDSNDTSYFGDFSSTSVINRINLVGALRRSGNTTTFIDFPSNNNIGFSTNNSRRLTISNTNITSNVNIVAPRFVDRGNVSYYGDFGNSNSSLTVAGSIRAGSISDSERYNDTQLTNQNGGISINPLGSIEDGQNANIAVSGNNGDYALVYLNRINIGANLFSESNKYLQFKNDGVNSASISGDSFGNLYTIMQNGSYQVLNAGGNVGLSITQNSDVIVGDTDLQYSSSDATPLFGTISQNKFHVNGSIQLNGINDAVVIGRGTSSFFKANEIGFGFGSGLYQSDSSFLRIRNNTTLYSTGEARFSRLVDVNNTAFVIDPASASRMNVLDVDNRIRHSGNTGTHLKFDVNRAVFATNSQERLIVQDGQTIITNELRAPRFVDSDNTVFFIDPGATNSRIRALNVYSGDASATLNIGRGPNERIELLTTDTTGYLRYRQDETGTESHSFNFEIISNSTGTNRFNFNRDVNVTGSVISDAVQSSGDISAPRFVDSDNGTYYVDPAGSSVLNTMFLDSRISHRGDSDTWMEFSAENTWRVVTGGGSRLIVNNSAVTSNLDLVAPRFVDSANGTYQVNPASESRLNGTRFDGTVNFRNGSTPARSHSVSTTGNTSELGNIGFELYSPSGSGLGAGLSFHRAGSYGLNMGLDSDNVFRIGGWSAQPNLLQLTNQGTLTIRQTVDATQFRDSSNTSFYLDPAGNSVLQNTRVAGRLRIGSSDARYIAQASGNHGTIKVEGGISTWAGYAIRDDWLLMSDGAERVGLYNDTDNKFSMMSYRNNRLDLYYNGVVQAQTRNGFFLANNQMRAPIYYDSDDTNAYLNPNSTSVLNIVTLNQLNMKDRGDYLTFYGDDNGAHAITSRNTSGDPSDNLRFNSYNNFIFNADSNNNNGNDSGIFLGQHGASAGAVTNLWAFQAKNDGITQASQSFRAPIFYDSNDTGFYINPASQSNFNTLTLTGNRLGFVNSGFDAEIRVSDANPNGAGAEFVFYGDTGEGNAQLRAKNYIATGDIRSPIYYDQNNTSYYVDPSSQSYVRGLFRVAGGHVDTQISLEAIGSELNTNQNSSMSWWVSEPSNSWNNGGFGYNVSNESGTFAQKNTSFGQAYMRFIQDGRLIFYNANSSGVRTTTMELYTAGTVVVNNYLTGRQSLRAPIFYDSDNTGFYANPSSNSIFNTAQFNNIRIGGSGGSLVRRPTGNYGSIDVTENAVGGWSGYSINSQYNFMANSSTVGIYNDIDNEWMIQANRNSTTRLYFNGGLQAETQNGFFLANSQMRSPIYYDSNNTTFRVDPSGSSIMQYLELRDYGLRLRRNNTHNGIWFNGGTDDNHVLWNDLFGGPNSRSSTATGFDGIKWNTYAGIQLRGGTNGGINLITVTNSGGSANNHIVRMYAHNVEQLGTRNGYALANNQMRSPIYYDSDNTAYRVDPTGSTNISSLSFYGKLNWNSAESSVYGRNILSFASAGAAGDKMFPDEEFEYGFNSVGIYNNAGGSALTYTRVTDAAAPNSSKRKLVFTRSTGSNGTTPGQGGFRFAHSTTQNNVYVCRFKAKLAANKRFVFATNTLGTGGTSYWLSSDQGTGKWEEYVYMIKTGTGSTSSTTYFYTQGGSQTGTMFELASATVFNVTKPNESSSTVVNATSKITAPRFEDSNNTGFYLDPASSGKALNVNGEIRTPSTWIAGTGSSGYRENIRLFGGVSTIGFNVPGETGTPPNSILGFGDRLEFRRSGTWEHRVYSNRVEIRNDVRAPIFRDTNNTAFYTDPASTSVMNRVDANNFYAEDWFRNKNNGEGILNDANNTRFYSDGSSRYTVWTAQNSSQILFRSNGGTARGYAHADSSNNIGFLNNSGSWRMRIVSADYGQFDGSSVRARLFYDLDNTGFYTNPASTSVMNQVNYNLLNGPSTSSFDKIRVYGSSSYSIGMVSGITHGGLNDWAMTFRMNNENDRGFWWGDDGMTTAQAAMSLTTQGFLNVSERIRVGFGQGDTTAPRYQIDASGSIRSTGDMRSPIFYDSNNTAFRFDGASTSRLNVLDLDGTIRHSDDTNTYIQFHAEDQFRVVTGGGERFEVQNGAINLRTNTNVTGSLGVNGSISVGVGANSSNIFMRDVDNNDRRLHCNSGRIGFLNTSNGWGSYSTNGGDWFSDQSIRSPIFYDSNDTNYRFDGAGTSRFNRIEINSALFNVGEGMELLSKDVGIGGNDGRVLRMLDSNSPNDPDGHFAITSGTNDTLIFGLNRFLVNLYYDGSLQAQTQNGFFLANNQMRAPIYYDSDDTGYYTNPNSSSRMNRVVPNSIDIAVRGEFITFYGDSSTQHGIGSRDLNGAVSDDLRINSYGSVLINLDSNNNNGSAADFRIGRHGAATGTITNNEMFAVFPDANYCSSSGDFRAPLYSDLNDTGKYVNPSATSQFNGLRMTGRLEINRGDPTINFRDNNGSVAFWHVNSNQMYLLRGETNATGWTGASGQSGWPLTVNLNNYDANFGGAITARRNITAFSDRNKKKDIKPLESALHYLDLVESKRYIWKDSDKEDIGFIAQDMEAAGLGVFVNDNEITDVDTGEVIENVKSLDYGKITSVLWKMNAEQQEQIEKQQDQINELKEMVKALLNK